MYTDVPNVPEKLEQRSCASKAD